ncbi:MAG: SEC-C metal-binding domain-containing protein [Bacteriovoracia bacterium]
MSDITESSSNTSTAKIGRNEPCPCGSGKKYKRCCGVDAQPMLSTPKVGAQNADAAKAVAERAGMAGFDPSQIDPSWMANIQKAMRRLPKAQVHRIQQLVQKAMAGKDVSREAQELERYLPPEFQSLIAMSPMLQQMAQGGMGAPEGMSMDEARKTIEEAVKAGKISQTEAAELLKGADAPPAPGAAPAEASDSTAKKKGLWGKIFGK